MDFRKGLLAIGFIAFAAFATHDSDEDHAVWQSVVTGDADGNGRIDRITLTFDRGVRSGMPQYGLITLPVTNPNYRVTTTTYAGSPGDYVNRITLVLAEGADGDTGIRPQVNYRHDHVHHEYSVMDPAGIELAEGDGRQATDGAGPVIVQALYHGPEGGSAAFLRLRFSEPLADPGAFPAPGDAFDLSGGGAFGSGATVTTGAVSSDDTWIVRFGSDGFAPTLGVSTIRIRSGAVGILDPSGNPPPSNNQAAVIDDIHGAPRLLAVTAYDRDGNARIDTYKAVFDRPVQDATFNPAQFTGNPYRIIGLTSGPGDAVNDRTLHISLQERVNPNTGTAGEFTANPGLILGEEGAPSNAVASGDVIEVDEAVPRFVSAFLIPGESKLTVRFSEPVATSILGGNLNTDDFACEPSLTIASVEFPEGQSTGTIHLVSPLGSDAIGNVRLRVKEKEVYDRATHPLLVPGASVALSLPVDDPPETELAIAASSDSGGGGRRRSSRGQCFVPVAGRLTLPWLPGIGLALLAGGLRRARQKRANA